MLKIWQNIKYIRTKNKSLNPVKRLVVLSVLQQKQNEIFSNVSSDCLLYSWTNGLILFFLLFCIGLTGILFNYRNYLVTMLCIEIMYLGITVCFLIVGVSSGDPKGQIYGLCLLIIAAAESAIGLGLLVVLFRFGGSIDFIDYEELKG